MHALLEKNIAQTQTTLLQLRSIFTLAAFRALSGYSRLSLVLGVLLIAGLWAFVWHQINYEYDRAIAEASRETMNLAIAFEENVCRILSDADGDLIDLRQSYERGGISDSAFKEDAQRAADSTTRSLVAVYDEQGTVVSSFIRDTVGANRSHRDYFLVHRNSDKDTLYIDKPIVETVGGLNTISLTRRINKPDGSFGGIVFIGLKSDYFLDFYKRMNLGQDQSITLIGLDGIIRARQSGDQFHAGQDLTKSILWQKIRNSPAGTYIANGALDNISRILSYRVIPDYPLVFTIGKSTSVALAEFEERKLGYILGASIISLLILAFCGLQISSAMKQRALNRKLEEKVCQLQESTTKYQTLVENSPDAIARFSSNCELLFINPEGERRFASPSASFVGKHIRDWGVSKNIWEKWQSSIKYVVSTGRKLDVEMEYDEAIKETKNVRIIWVPEFDEAGRVSTVLGISRNNTEQKQAQERFLKAFSMNPNIMMITSIQGETYIDVNESFLKAAGLAREQIIGQSIQSINLWHDSKEVQAVRDALREHGGIRNFEISYRNNNEMCSGLLSIEIIMIENRPCILSILTDITAKKQLESELARFDRLNLIGEMAASIGHEVRNPMTTVRGYLQMFQRKPESAAYRGQFETMIEELDRANVIISEFLSLAKNRAIELKTHNLNDVIKSLLPLLQAEALHTGQQILVDLGDIPNVHLDEKEIRQLLLNLSRNGFEAMKTGGRLTIMTYTQVDKIVLGVHDTGPGIPTNVLNKLGTPFITTKENGTGLGLPVCYRVAERHKATIDVKTSPQGTTFFISFPI